MRANQLAKPCVFVICLVPAGLLVSGLVTGGLGPNPVETLVRETGQWALRFLLLALAITPVRKITGWNVLARYRRMIGLYAFFYGFAHMSMYVGLDHFFHWQTIWTDIVKRPYITLGLTAVVILTALAVTSPAKMVRKMGGKAWQKLHRFVYLAGICGVLHFILLVKANQIEPFVYGAILAGLLGYRLVGEIRKRKAKARAMT